MDSSSAAAVTAADWMKGIAFSVLASVIGGASKLAIRKSWLMVEGLTQLTAEGSGDSPIGRNHQSEEQQQHNRHAHDHSSVEIGSSSTPPPSDDDTPAASPRGIELQERPASAMSLRSRSISPPSGAMMCRIPSTLPTTASATSFLDHGTPHTDPIRAKKIRRRSYFLRLCGMVGMTVLNPLCCVLAMNYASPSILAPFSGLTLVWIVLLSESLIGERPTLVQVMAAALIILGETIVAVFGDHTNDNGKSIEDVRKSYLDPAFLVYFAAMVLWVLALAYSMTKSRSKTVRRFAWGVSGGSITGLQNFLKDSLTIIKAVAPGGPSEGMPYPWLFYLLASCAASTAFVGLLFLVACMKKYDATFSSAMFVGSFVVSASIMAAVHYSTFQNLNGLASYILYPFGLLVLMAGVGILVRNTSPSREDVLECSNHDLADGYRGDVIECDGDDASCTSCRRDMEPLVSPNSAELT